MRNLCAGGQPGAGLGQTLQTVFGGAGSGDCSGVCAGKRDGPPRERRMISADNRSTKV